MTSYQLRVTRALTQLAVALITAAHRVEAKAVGLHIRRLQAAKQAAVSGVIESQRQHDKFESDIAARIGELRSQADRSYGRHEKVRREAAALSVGVSLEIQKYQPNYKE